MTNQPQLFAATTTGRLAVPVHNGTPTSIAAAKAVHYNAQQKRILALFSGSMWANGLTQDDAAEALNLPRSSMCARFSELVDTGDIVATDKTRATKYGRQAVVYRMGVGK